MSHDVAAKWRATRWWGVDIGDPEIVVWGSPDRARRAGPRSRPARPAAAHRAAAGVRDVGGEARRVRRAHSRAIRPRCCSAIRPRWRTSRGTRRARRSALDDLGIRVAFVTSERLYDDQRATIAAGVRLPRGQRLWRPRRRVHRPRVPRRRHAHHCRGHRRRDCRSPTGAPCRPGEPGEIVVTHLATRDFPFIRYRTGDVGVLDTAACACGRGLPLLKEIQGRTTDFVVAARRHRDARPGADLRGARPAGHRRRSRSSRKAASDDRVLLVPGDGLRCRTQEPRSWRTSSAPGRGRGDRRRERRRICPRDGRASSATSSASVAA